MLCVVVQAAEFFYRGADFGEEKVKVQDLGDMYGDCLLTANILDWAIALAQSPQTAPTYVIREFTSLFDATKS
jgi:hypothetical protein